jgi:hypothetical protein
MIGRFLGKHQVRGISPGKPRINDVTSPTITSILNFTAIAPGGEAESPQARELRAWGGASASESGRGLLAQHPPVAPKKTKVLSARQFVYNSCIL